MFQSRSDWVYSVYSCMTNSGASYLQRPLALYIASWQTMLNVILYNVKAIAWKRGIEPLGSLEKIIVMSKISKSKYDLVLSYNRWYNT